ncbi:MAG: signal peptide peptidase SppA [Fuerstiella sp.]
MKLFRFTLPALVAMLGCSLLVGPPAFGQAAAAEGLKVQASKKAGSVVIPVFNLSGPFTEKPVADDNPFAFGAAEGQSLYSMMETLRQVKDDDAVPAIVLVVNSPSIGRAQLEELSRCFDELKAAGKKIHVHSDTFSMGQYALVSHASEISMVPTGYLFITGLYGEQMFLKGLLDKISVKPDFFTCGDFKTAAEMFMRKGPSPQAQEMSKWLYDDIYANMLQLIADGRNVTPEKAEEWVDQGVFTAEDALKAGVVDQVEHRQDLESRLRDLYGSTLKFHSDYGTQEKGKIDLSSPFGVMNFYAELLSPSTPKKSTKPAVGIVYLEGSIMDGNPSGNPFLAEAAAFSGPIRKALDAAAEDDAIKCVVFRVNSPGGSAVASEVILNAAKRVAAKKPLIVSMGDVAGSGGYYVACATDTIVAEPSTITGSIGVVSGKMATGELWNRLGINFSPIARGKNAALLGSLNVFTDSEREAMQNYMNATYVVFKGHVTAIRGDKLSKPIDELAGGRVYTGKQALELGLVDRLGGLTEAIELAAKKAKLSEGYEVRIVPRPQNFIEMLMSDLNGKKDDGNHIALKLMSPEIRGLWQQILPVLNTLDADRVKAVTQALLQLSILQADGVSLTMPIQVSK